MVSVKRSNCSFNWKRLVETRVSLALSRIVVEMWVNLVLLKPPLLVRFAPLHNWPLDYECIVSHRQNLSHLPFILMVPVSVCLQLGLVSPVFKGCMLGERKEIGSIQTYGWERGKKSLLREVSCLLDRNLHWLGWYDVGWTWRLLAASVANKTY